VTALLLAALIAQATPQRDTRPASSASAGAISGVVTTADAQPRPLRRVWVTVSGSSLAAPRTVITADDGKFAVEGLPAGRYTIAAAKEGYVQMSYGATRPARLGAPVTVGDGARVPIAIRLPRGAVITGTVIDVDGQPAAGINVSVLARRYAGGSPGGGDYRYVPAGSPSLAITDDRGVYRVYGLPAGEYLVSAQPTPRPGGPPGTVGSIAQTMPRNGGTGTGRKVILTQTFHPGTADAARASRITVRAGEERSGIDVQLEYLPLATISGTANVPSGFGPARVTLWRTDELARPQTGPVTQTDEFGRFQFASIAPGQYRITARGTPASESGGGRGAGAASANVQYGVADVVVNGEDVEVALASQPALSISGRVLFESARAMAPQLPGQLRVNLPALPANGGWSMPPLFVDGTTFRLDGIVPGLYRTMVSLQGVRTPVGAWWLKSIVVNGRDLLDAPLDLQQGTDDAVVTFSDRASELAGTVTDAQRAPAADAYVVVFPADRGEWFYNSRRIAGVRTGSDGRYTIRNLPPGDYRIAATSELDQGEWFDPAVLERLLPIGERLTIAGPDRVSRDLAIR
jgi:protocatechuate 3,4-dioxygenase beta subunit